MLLYLNQEPTNAPSTLPDSFVFEKSLDKFMLALSNSRLKTSHFHINKARIIYRTTPRILESRQPVEYMGCQPKPNHKKTPIPTPTTNPNLSKSLQVILQRREELYILLS